MKKKAILIASMCILLLAFTVRAQDQKNDYFLGKWDMVAEGTPSGDSKMTVTIERKDGKLIGTVLPVGKEMVNISRFEEKEKSLTAYFNTGGYDVYLYVEKKDDDNVTGSLIDMFDVKGVRIKEK